VSIHPHDRRALFLATLASAFLIAALLLPMNWAFFLLIALGLLIGAVSAASSLRRLPTRRS
jgi:hypothetical protein